MTPRLRPELLGGLLVLLGAALWSTGGVCVKVLNGYGPVAISSGRSVISALFFLILLKGCVRPPSGMGRWIAVGAVVYAAVVLSFVMATRFTTAANAILLQYTAPLWIAFLGWVVLGERPSARELVAMGLGGTGVVFCASEGLTLFVHSRSVSIALAGDVIALVSGFCFALVTVILRITSKESSSPAPTSTMDSTSHPASASALVTAKPSGETGSQSQSEMGTQSASPLKPVAPATPPSSPPSPSPSLVCLFYGNILAAAIGLPALITQLPRSGIQGHSWWLGLAVLLWLGGGQLGGGYWFFQRGLRTTRALTASLIGLVEPVLNPLWVALLVAEVPSKGTRIGGVFVLVSVILSLNARRRGR